ncbi:MAG: 16S rRNA (uracil(1498)-N(3))-methyltransferase [Chitinophagales bacterium]
MRKPRFFCQPADRCGDHFRLPEGEAHHARSVLRLREGDAVLILDGSGYEHDAVLEAAPPGEGWLQARVVASRLRPTEPDIDLILLQGLPKSDKMDLVVQKATELGVRRVAPVLTERCVSRPEPGRAAAKVDRWQKIAQEASKQAGRSITPQVAPVAALKEALQALPYGCRLVVPWEEERRRSLREVAAEWLAKARPDQPSAVAVLIGPEGGLAEGEVEEARRRGGITVTLGPRVLRTETAGLVALACLLFATGNLE